MAESGNDTNLCNWWGGWIQSATEKSFAAYEYLKNDIGELTTELTHTVASSSSSAIDFLSRDLSEYRNCIQNDTSKVCGDLKEKLVSEPTSTSQKFTSGVSSILGGISKMLIIEPDSDDDAIEIKAPVFDRVEKRLHSLQIDPSTYSTDPKGSLENYHKWKDEFILENVKGQISQLLVENSQIRSLYTQMVPSSVSHADFWQRYFYKVNELEENEARRIALKQRVENVDNESNSLEWDDDWEEVSQLTISDTSSMKESTDSDSACILQTKSSSSLKNKDQKEIIDTIVESKCDITDVHEEINKNPSEMTDCPDVQTNITAEESNPITISDESTAKIEDNPECSSKIGNLNETSPKMEDKNESATETGNVIITEMVDDKSDLCEKSDFTLKLKGDMVVVQESDKVTLSSDDSFSKESQSLDEDWEDDIELTEADIKSAQEEASQIEIDADAQGDEWIDWD